MKLIGYARKVITDDDLKKQVQSLKEYGCQEIYEEDSLSLCELIPQLQSGDTLVVCRLNYLGKSTRQLTEITQLFQKHQVHFISLEEAIDTRPPNHEMYFHLMQSLSTMEYDLIKERTMLGLDKARKQGKIGGRPKIDQTIVKRIRQLYFENKETIQQISDKCAVSVGTCYKYINQSKEEAEMH